jgi:hypothetical protein
VEADQTRKRAQMKQYKKIACRVRIIFEQQKRAEFPS